MKGLGVYEALTTTILLKIILWPDRKKTLFVLFNKTNRKKIKEQRHVYLTLRRSHSSIDDRCVVPMEFIFC